MYTYKVRPGYGSDRLLIEFGSDTGDEQFVADLKAILNGSGITRKCTVDMVFLDRVYYDSPAGPFELDADEWCFIWIHADENQEAIHFIDRILQASGLFHKQEVYYEDYAKPRDHDTQ